MNIQSPSRLIRRHGPTNGTRSINGSPSSGSKFHGQRRNTSNLMIVAVLSFIAGIYLTNPAKSIEGGQISKGEPIEVGFEPPRVVTLRDNESGAYTDARVQDNKDESSGNTRSSRLKNRADSDTIHKNNSQPTRYKPQPRVVGVQISPHSPVLVYQISSVEINITEAEPSTPDGYAIEESWYQSNAQFFMDGHDFSKCVPMEKWQLESFVDCNKFHELDLSKMRMINRGGSRIAFELTQTLPSSNEIFKFVYKTMRYGKEIDTHQIEQQRKDSLVMERTTSSKFIPSIHGYCSLAVMMDFMPEGNLHDYIKGSRILSRKVNGAHGVEDTSGKLLKPVDRLRVGIHIATSVADLHGIDGTSQPSYFHNDLCCHQYLFQDGVFKLNDFNYARPIYIDKNTKKSCTRDSYGMMHWKGRSLEEHIKVLKMPFDPPVPDKIDVWMMGNIIYYILTDLYTFEKPENLNNHQVGKLLVEGKRSPYPEYIEKSSDPSHIAMKKALDMCWVQNWRERPSAREISDYMLNELRKITGEENPDVRVVLPERDPNQTPSDGEYNQFND